MKKIFYLLITSLSIQYVTAQNVGIGTVDPLARLHVADSSVLFSGPSLLPSDPGHLPGSGTGARLLWLPSRAAFRVGYFYSSEWDINKIGPHSFAVGLSAQASGTSAVAFHSGSLASGDQAIAFGQQSLASADYSAALGFQAKSKGYISTAIGYNTTSSGDQSIAIGAYSETVAERSHTIGTGLIANAYGQTVVGMNNVPHALVDADSWVADDPVFSVGNGKYLADRSTALTILKNGNTGIGTMAPSAKLQIEGNLLLRRNSGIGNAHLILEETGSNDGSRITFKSTNVDGKYWDVYGSSHSTDNAKAAFALYYYGVGNTFISYGNGNAWIRGTLSQNSDIRLKKDITRIEGALDKLVQLNGYTYHWKDSSVDSRLQSGLIAQEVETILPELVTTANNGTKSVNYTALIPYLLQAIKEQQAQIEKLQLEQNTTESSQQIIKK